MAAGASVVAVAAAAVTEVHPTSTGVADTRRVCTISDVFFSCRLQQCSVISKRRLTEIHPQANCLSAVMFPVASRGRPHQASEVSHAGRDTRQPAVVSLELKAIPVTGGRAEPAVDAEFTAHRNHKQRDRSFSPLCHDTPVTRTDATRNLSESISARGGLYGDIVRQSHRFHRAAVPATATNKQIAAAHLPPLLNADSECRIFDVNEATQSRKSEGTVRPFEVCALRLNPDIKSLSTRAQCHRQQSTGGVTAGNNKTDKSVSAMSSLPRTTPRRSTSDAVKFDLRLPLSDNDNEVEEQDDDDDDDDSQETMECCHSGSGDKMSTVRSVSCDTPGITVASCPILSVRIEFCKSQRKPGDADNTSPSTTTQSDSGCSSSGDAAGRRRMAGRTPHKTKNTKIVCKPSSTSKSICVAGRGKVVVIDDGVYDQFARRQPPKYLSNRMVDAMLNKRTFSK